MSNPTTEREVLRAADSCGPSHDMEIYVKDAAGNIRTLVASRGPPPQIVDQCRDHFIALGVCVDCTQLLGRTLWARER
jgi:hypothetical protein